MMRVYAEVAGLRNRYLFVLPFLTPTIASLWVGTVTPIPPGLARPLVESLERDRGDAQFRHRQRHRAATGRRNRLSAGRGHSRSTARHAGLPEPTWVS